MSTRDHASSGVLNSTVPRPLVYSWIPESPPTPRPATSRWTKSLDESLSTNVHRPLKSAGPESESVDTSVAANVPSDASWISPPVASSR